MKKMAFSLALVLAFLGTSNAQLTSPSPNLSDLDCWNLINHVRSIAVKPANGPQVGQDLTLIIQTMVNNVNSWDYFNSLQGHLVNTISGARLAYWMKSSPHDVGLIVQIMYLTRRGCADNSTDAHERDVVGKTGLSVIVGVHATWSNKQLTNSVIEVLENEPPDVAAALYQIIPRPYWYSGDLPDGANDTTWASDSLWNVLFCTAQAEWARRSVVVRLLAQQGRISIPGSVDAEYTWSGWPDTVIYLPQAGWSAADKPELTRLLPNPYYGVTARQVLNGLH